MARSMLELLTVVTITVTLALWGLGSAVLILALAAAAAETDLPATATGGPSRKAVRLILKRLGLTPRPAPTGGSHVHADAR